MEPVGLLLEAQEGRVILMGRVRQMAREIEINEVILQEIGLCIS